MDAYSMLYTRLQNGHRARKQSITMPHSKKAHTLLTIFQQEQLIAHYQTDGTTIHVQYQYKGDALTFQQIKRISKPGRRVYSSVSSLSPNGLTILSTPKGMMTAREARNLGIGGELLCEIRFT